MRIDPDMKARAAALLERIRMDGFINVMTGLGHALRDKTMATRFVGGIPLDDATIEALITDNDLASRIVEVVPEEMMRPGFDLVSEENPRTADVTRRWGELEGHAAFVDAMTWGRAFGGGAVYVGVNDGIEEHEPIDQAKVKGIDFLHALDRRELHVSAYYDDPRAPKFGKPKLYQLHSQRTNPTSARSGQIEIHESRLIVFGGARTTNWQRRNLRGWDYGVLQRVNTVLTQFGTTWDGVAHLMSDIAQAIFKIKGLADYVGSGGEEQLMKRLEAVELGRSVARAVPLDAEDESFERISTPLTDVPEILQLFILRMSAAARMPATIMFAQSPAGLNATGESDLRWFYNTVDADRQHKLKPKMQQLFRLLWAEQGGEPKSWDIEFKPLWEPTAKEASEIRKQQADADVAYVREGILFPAEVALSRFTPRGWSAATRLGDTEVRKKILEADAEHALETAENPPEPTDPNADPQPDGE